MANIRPFRGLRYDLARLKEDAGRLLAPPYDVVDEAGRAELAARSPWNSIHFILPQDGNGADRYANGAARFRQMVTEVMARDEAPSIYVYHQRFEVEGAAYTRKGFITTIELTRFGHGPVLAHERTLAGPKADRLNLMRACEAHLELVFGMFSDPARRWEDLVEPAKGEPVLTAEFDGVEHSLWRVSEPQAVEGLVAHLRERNIYIADGHHRYETMCSFRDELEQRGHQNAAYGLIYLSNLDDPGLVVLPTHRLVHGLKALDLPAVLEKAKAWFDVREATLPSDPHVLREELARAGAERASFGLSVPGSKRWTLLQLRADFDPAKAGLGALPAALTRLDVVLLHELVLEQSLGISKQAQADKTNLRYDKSTPHALQNALQPSDDTQLVCFMNPTPVSDVRAVCDSGHVMPQKSTFFYPKIPNGLVFFDLSES